MNLEMLNHFDRWSEGYEENLANIGPVLPWNNRVSVIKAFLENRPISITEAIQTRFQLTGTYELEVKLSDPDAGYVVVNSLQLSSEEWRGVYFNEIPISLRAVANEGYRFSHWNSDTSFVNSSVVLDPSDDVIMSPIFEAYDD